MTPERDKTQSETVTLREKIAALDAELADDFKAQFNVRYAGVSISVDTILSDIARSLGFEVEKILVVPGKKGNSSQQMGAYGRVPLRKCVYVWRKR